MLVVSHRTKILIDNGLSLRQLVLRTEAIGESLDGLAGVFVTHEHGDHVNGLGVLARKLDVPVYMSKGTQACLPKTVGELPRRVLFDPGDALSVGDIELKTFQINHDAADPVSYVVRSGGAQLGVATDLGKATNVVRHALKGSHALVLESNYCPTMLRDSSYPATIRERIRSSVGHLSNPDMNSLLAHLLHDALRLVVLVHISQENNREDLAKSLAARVLKGHPASLVVAQQDSPMAMVELLGSADIPTEQIA